jgi:antitoxin YefM
MVHLFKFLNRFNAMKVVTYSHARNALKSVLDDVVRDADVTIISRRDAEGDAVVMSLDHYNSLVETLHLLSTPANADALARAIRQDQAGEAQPRTLIDADNG